MITLTGKEALYIAAKTGAEQFPGIKNDFLNMSLAEIKKECISVQDSLIKKGYGELGFDGEFSIKEEVQTLIKICTEADSYVLFEVASEYERTDIQMYFKAEFCVKSVYTEGVYQIEESAKADFCEELKAAVIKNSNHNNQLTEDEEMQLPQRAIEAIDDDSEINAIARIKNLGINDKTSAALYNCFSKKNSSMHFVAVDFAGEKIQELNGIISEEGNFLISDIEQEYEDLIKVSVVSSDKLLNHVINIMTKMGLWEEAGFI